MTLAHHGQPLLDMFQSIEQRRYRGGMKESGIGRENGIEAFESCG